MCYFRVVVDMSECQSSGPGLFSGREGYNLVLIFEMVDLLCVCVCWGGGGGGGWVGGWDETECLILLFWLFEVM